MQHRKNFINFLSVLKSELFTLPVNSCHPPLSSLILTALLLSVCLVPSTQGARAQHKALCICANSWTVCCPCVRVEGNEALRNCHPLAPSLEQNWFLLCQYQSKHELEIALFFFFLSSPLLLNSSSSFDCFTSKETLKCWKAFKIDLQF